MNKKIIGLLAAMSVLTQAGCSGMAFTAASLIVSENLSNHMIHGRNAIVGPSWKNKDIDFRETKNTEVSSELVQLVKNNGIVRVDTVNKKLVPFSKEEFQVLRQKNGHYDEGIKSYWDKLFFTSFNLKKEERYDEITRMAIEGKGIIVLKGLSNESVKETIDNSKRFTDKGLVVLIAPQLMQKFKGNFTPTIVNANVLANGDYGCPEDKTLKCRTYSGIVGLVMDPRFKF